MRRLGISQIKCGQFWPYFCILIDAGPTSFCPYTYIFWQFCWTNYSSTLIYFYRSHDLIRWLLWRHLRAVPKFPLENWRCKTAIMWQSGASAGHLAGDVMDSGGDIVQIVQWSRPLYLVSSETWIPQQHSIEIKQFHTRDVKQRKKVLIFCNKLMNLPSWLLAS